MQEHLNGSQPKCKPYRIDIAWNVTMADRMLADGGGCARFGWDDRYLVGPRELFFSILDRFTKDVEDNCGLVLQRTKT